MKNRIDIFRQIKNKTAVILMVLCSVTPPLSADSTYPVIFEAIQKASLAAEREGQLLSINGPVGSTFKAGDVLAEIKHTHISLEKKRHTVAWNYFSRQVDNLSHLKKKGVASEDELAAALRDRDTAATDIAITETQIDYSIIRAPFDGSITKRHVSPFEWLSPGEDIIDVINTSAIKAISHLPAHYAVNLKIGDTNEFFIKDINETATGEITAISSAVDVKSNTIQIVWIIKDQPHRLLSGMKGTLKLAALNP